MSASMVVPRDYLSCPAGCGALLPLDLRPGQPALPPVCPHCLQSLGGTRPTR